MSIKFVQGGTPNPAPPPPDDPDPPLVEDWNLPAGHFVSTDVTGMAPVITFPRPEASSNAYCKNAYNDGTRSIKWEIPIVVQGGSWPFRYQVTQGPVGMVMGEKLSQGVDSQTVGETYATLWWDDPQPGSYEITVLVTDQDLNPATVTWTLVVGSSNWVFVDAGADDDTGAGTFGDPLKTWQGIWKGSDADSTYANKVACFYDGTYLINENGTDTKADITLNKKPTSYVPFHNGTSWATVVFDESTAALFILTSDVYIGRIRFDGYNDTAKNFRAVNLGGLVDCNRNTFYRLTFSNMTLTAIWTLGRQYYDGDWTHDSVDPDLRTTYQVLVDHVAGAIDGTLQGDIDAGLIGVGVGIVGGDNPACIFANGSASANSRSYLSVVRCVEEPTVGFMLFECYDTNYVVAEHCVGDDVTSVCSNGASLMFAKNDNNNVTFRANRCINKTTTADYAGMGIGVGTQAEKRNNHELCWNLTETTTPDPQNRTAPIHMGAAGSNGTATNVLHYRNTHIEHLARTVRYEGGAGTGDPCVTLGNALATGGSTLVVGSWYDDSLDPIANQTFETTDFDANGDLVDRVTKLGTYGYEVA